MERHGKDRAGEPTAPDTPGLRARFGHIDIYLFDQLLRGRIHAGMRICDAGCGRGRNLAYFLQGDYEVVAADADPEAVDAARAMAVALRPGLPQGSFRVEPVEAMSFPAGAADVVISSAVLHFAADDEHFDAMLDGCWRVLAGGGLFFCRLASSIGIEDRVREAGAGRFVLPDGSMRYLVTAARLMDLTSRLGADLLDPIKTTVVQDQRAMTTWVLRKR